MRAVKLYARDFEQALAGVLPCVCKDLTRPFLVSVLFELEGDVLRLITTDTCRLGVAEIPVLQQAGDEPTTLVTSWIVDADRLAKLRIPKTCNFAELEFGVPSAAPSEGYETDLVATCGKQQATCYIMDGHFPNWRRVVPPDWDATAHVNAGDLLKVADCLGLPAAADSNRLCLKSDGASLHLGLSPHSETCGPVRAHADLPMTRDGEAHGAFEVNLSAAYLADFLRPQVAPFVLLDWSSEKLPVRLRWSAPGAPHQITMQMKEV